MLVYQRVPIGYFPILHKIAKLRRYRPNSIQWPQCFIARVPRCRPWGGNSKHAGNPIKNLAWLGLVNIISMVILVVDRGWPTPLKNDGVRQIGSWSQLGKMKHVPNHQPEYWGWFSIGQLPMSKGQEATPNSKMGSPVSLFKWPFRVAMCGRTHGRAMKKYRYPILLGE